MSRESLFRLVGVVAILGGLLRAIDVFATEFSGINGAPTLFLVTDLLLLFAIIGLYGRLTQAAGWLGLIGFGIAVIGIVTVRSAADDIDTEVYGTAACAFGVAVFGIAVAVARAFPILGPILWVVALFIGAVAFALESDVMIEFAGVAFGLGFVLAGISLFRHPATPP
jgi:hypothetical protein